MARTLALFSICVALTGCELVVDFDRSKIPTPDAGMKPGVTPTTDAAMPPVDAGMPDGAVPPDDDGGPDDDAGAVADDAGL